MNLIVWGLILLGIVVLIIIIRNKMKKQDYIGNSLDERLSGIRSKWDDVCAKIKHMVGC